MKPIKTLVCIVALYVLPIVLGAAWAADTVKLTLMHVNDVYQLGPVDKGKNGGLARLATQVQRIRQDAPHSLFIFGGDTLSPSVASNTFRGAQMIAGWNALKVDLAVIGNHEFDFGPEVFRQRLDESEFPWLAANMRERGGVFKGAKNAVGTSRMFEFGGVKVGFVGVLTPSTAVSSKPGEHIVFEDPLETVQREAQSLRQQGAVAVVALTHLDMADDRRIAASGSVDVVMGGHDHALLQALVGRTPIFKSGSDARILARVDLVFDSGSRRLLSTDWEMLPINASLPEDAEVAKVVSGFEEQLSVLLDQTVGETAVELDARQENNRSRETNFGNWLADVYRASTQADVGLVNGGSIRSNSVYGPGKLSKRDILSILPFENPIVKLQIPGYQLRAALEHGVAAAHRSNENGAFLQVSGMRFVFDPSRPAGDRVVEMVVNDQALDAQKSYTLAVNGYLANGGDGYAMLKGLPFLLKAEDGLSETAEVIEALLRQKVIQPKVEGRIQRVADGR